MDGMRIRFLQRTALLAGAIVLLTVMMLTACTTAYAQTLSTGQLAGDWQGTMQADPAQRIVLKITASREAGGKPSWKAVMYNLDSHKPSEGRATEISMEGDALHFAIAAVDVSYDGKLSPDGGTIAGEWTEGGHAHPLTLAHVGGDAAWTIPAENKSMPTNADPDWEVVTVRPSDPNEKGSMLGPEGRQVLVKRHTVETMLLVGYDVHKKQLINAPDWIATDRWDVAGVPDVPGTPHVPQLQSLMRKLLVERFGLVSHTEQREIPVYALRVGKGDPKLEKSAGDPNGQPNENDSESGGQRTMRMTNAKMGELALLLKMFLDRPVVDQTGLTGRYDFALKWTFDETTVPADGSAAPSVFTAIQEQLGLKLEPVKTATDVMVIDKIEKPGAN
jgi:uncharacterized protein (TIGR03435 family)